jgi:hypothetical protein
VCLGGQLLAVANGGQVAPNPDGPEFGAQLIAKRAASANDPLFGPLPITPDVIQWHFDAINSLPPGALQLASSPGCAVQAFRLGRLAWGIQFHIETTPEIVRGWAATDARALEGYDVQRLLSHADGVHDDLAEVWAPFATSFADVVRDPAAYLHTITLAFFAAGDTAPRILMELDNTEACKRVVLSGLGAALLPEMAIRSELARGDLVQLRVEGHPPPKRAIHALTRQGAELSAAATALLRLMG